MGAIVLLLLAAVLTGVACYNFICVGKDIPTGQTSKMMILSGRREGSRKEMLGDVYISKVASMFSGMIRLDPLKRSELENALHLSGINQTPETYVASATARGLLIILAFIPVAIISPLFMILGIALGCLMGPSGSGSSGTGARTCGRSRRPPRRPRPARCNLAWPAPGPC